MHIRIFFIAIALALTGALAADDHVWQFEDWDGPTIDVWTYVPADAGADTPVVIVMHGWSRDVERYFYDWRALGEQQGFIVAVPYFPKDEFPSSWHYNQGNVFERNSNAMRPQTQWSFTAVEGVFDAIIETTASEREGYTLYGHSAGSQFVHRFLYYMPDARVDRYIAANAGWYTMADFRTRYPYGLKDSEVSEADLRAAFSKDMVLMLGREDTDQTSSSLRKTPEAMRQGENRFTRGLTFYSVAKITAEELDADLKWRVVVVDDAGHVNAEMASAAAKLVE